MLRIGSMNMLLHGVESPDIRFRDSLAQEQGARRRSTPLVRANPTLAGSLDCAAGWCQSGEENLSIGDSKGAKTW
jgi:hypothetical protein